MLHIEQLTHVYPNGTRALDGVTLEIPRGMFGLLGPNGAGKSSLMRCIATLQVPTSGGIRFGDLDVLASPGELRARLGYLPQDFGVYPRVTAYDMLDHLAVLKGLTVRGERKAAVEALLQQVNLWDVRKKALAGFSGGMRQRFGIAQALLGNPELVIVDEPTAGLDPDSADDFCALLRSLHRELALTVVMVTHDLDTLFELSTHMAVVADKRIIVSGSPATVMAYPHPFIHDFFQGPRGKRAATLLQTPPRAA